MVWAFVYLKKRELQFTGYYFFIHILMKYTAYCSMRYHIASSPFNSRTVYLGLLPPTGSGNIVSLGLGDMAKVRSR